MRKKGINLNKRIGELKGLNLWKYNKINLDKYFIQFMQLHPDNRRNKNL